MNFRMDQDCSQENEPSRVELRRALRREQASKIFLLLFAPQVAIILYLYFSNTNFDSLWDYLFAYIGIIVLGLIISFFLAGASMLFCALYENQICNLSRPIFRLSFLAVLVLVLPIIALVFVWCLAHVGSDPS